MKKFFYLFFLVLLSCIDVNLAQAAIAVGPHCDQETLQGAIEAATGSNNEIQVLSTYTSGPVSITNKIIQIKGGYTLATTDDTCAFPIAPVNNATSSMLDGTGTTGPLVSISGDSKVELHNFIITGAHNEGHNGGGISFTSSQIFGASLDLYATQIVDNHADRGGGIFYDGEASTDQLTLHEGSFIVSNTANVAGGGIAIQGHTYLLMNSPQTTISNNLADIDRKSTEANGGGIHMRNTTRADIGSIGYDGFATIDHNQAGSSGGGIYAEDQANVRIYSTATGILTRVENNSAHFGGGIYLYANDSGYPQLCGYGAGINLNNAALDGSAIYGNGFPTEIPINFDDRCIDALGNAPPNEAVCALDQPCNTIDGNIATAVGGEATVKLNDSVFKADRIRFQGNSAAIQISNNFTSDISTLTSCLIAGNNVSGRPKSIFNLTLAPMIVDSCTIAGNTGTFNGVFSTGDDISDTPFVTLKNSIVDQTGTFASDFDPTKATVLNSTANDATNCVDVSFNLCQNFKKVPPSFVNPSVNDYHLTISSPIDYYSGCSGTDLDGLPRGVTVLNNGNPCDPGAYEFQKPTFPADENFDEANPSNPVLPSAWPRGVTSQMTSPGWSVVGNFPSSAPYSAYTPSLPFQSDSTLATPPFFITHAGLVSFKHLYGLEAQYDGAILELSINGAPFKEITRAGGRFVTGGYPQHLLHGSTPNPIEALYPGCAAWTGGTVGYEDVSVELPASANGKNVQILWRVGTDGNNGSGYAGYHLDDIHVDQNRTTSDLIFADVFGD